MIDPEKVEQQIAAMAASLAPYVEGDRPNNVVSRCQAAVIPAFIRWKMGEMNRSSDQNAVLNAFVAFVCSQMGALVVDCAEGAQAQFDLANKLLQAIGEEIGAILSGTSDVQQHSIPAESAH